MAKKVQNYPSRATNAATHEHENMLKERKKERKSIKKGKKKTLLRTRALRGGAYSKAKNDGRPYASDVPPCKGTSHEVDCQTQTCLLGRTPPLPPSPSTSGW